MLHGLPWGLIDRESGANAGDMGSIPGSGRSTGEGNGYPFQYPCLGNPMDGGRGCSNPPKPWQKHKLEQLMSIFEL